MDENAILNQLEELAQGLGITIRYEPIPIETYKVKPEKFEKVPVNIQWPQRIMKGMKK